MLFGRKDEENLPKQILIILTKSDLILLQLLVVTRAQGKIEGGCHYFLTLRHGCYRNGH
jgi:hypothetical protein